MGTCSVKTIVKAILYKINSFHLSTIILLAHVATFPAFTIATFPALATRCKFFGLTTRCKFSCACHTLRLFPRLPRVTSFPALATRCKFSRACHMLQGFLALAACCKYRCMICHDLVSVDSRFWRMIPPPPAHSTITTIYHT